MKISLQWRSTASILLLLFGFGASPLAIAQTAPAPVKSKKATPKKSRPSKAPAKTEKIPPLSQTVTVVGTLDPVTEAQSQRATVALPVQPHRLTLPGIASLLRDDPSVDVEQRGAADVQDDISIRGASYEETLVLLNGLRINDAETSHFNFDVPVPLDALGGEYILHGAGSTLYGSDAVSGVVNVTTEQPGDGLRLRLRSGLASFGGNDEAFVASWARGRDSEVLAGGRDFSEGFIADRDYRSEEADSESRFHTFAGDSDILLAGSDRAFGAAGYYGDYPSYERTKGWFSAITQQINPRTQAALAFRRHSDVFVLFRNDPSAYPENNHVDTSWQGVVRRNDWLHWWSTELQYGLDINADQIASSSLGHHGRNRGAGYLNARFRTDKRFSFTTGLREEIFSGGRNEFVPSFSAADYLRPSLKLRADASRGFRLPTYTDLYYNDPDDIGNPNLKPESAWSYEGGLDWYPSAHWMISATGFTSLQTDVIDYVRANSSLPWQAENLSHVTLAGSEFSALWQPLPSQEFRIGLTTLHGTSAALDGLQSKYAFDFPTENALMEWNAHWHNGLMLRNRLRVVHRVTGELYPVLDSSIAYDYGRIHPYLQMTNLTNSYYQEVVGVVMPPRAFAGGIELQLGKIR